MISDKTLNTKRWKDISIDMVVSAQLGVEEAIDDLWKLCEPFVKYLSSKWILNQSRNGYCDIEDLRQCGYLAFRKALEKWKPVGTANFFAYFTYWVRYFFQKEIGIAGPKEPAKSAFSLDAEINNSGAHAKAYIDFLQDKEALCAYKLVEDYDFARVVRDEVEKLPEPERQVVKCFHFNKLSLQTIAQNLGISPSLVNSYRESGYQILRKNKIIQALYAEIRCAEPNPYEKVSLRAFKTDRISSPEWVFFAKEQLADDIRWIFETKE